MSLRLMNSQVEQMIREARAAAPDECCGILTGRRERERVMVSTLEPAANVWDGDRRSRFLLEPRTHLRVQRECRAAGLEIVGFYHSHPDSPPVPSLFDREMAWPDHAYVIVSLSGPEPSLRTWRLTPGGDRFEEQPLVIAPAR